MSDWYRVRINVLSNDIDKPYLWCKRNVDSKMEKWIFRNVFGYSENFNKTTYDYFFTNQEDAIMFSLVWL
jgi:hypothetical protein